MWLRESSRRNYRLQPAVLIRLRGDNKDSARIFDALEAANPPLVDAPSMFSPGDQYLGGRSVAARHRSDSYEVYRVSL